LMVEVLSQSYKKPLAINLGCPLPPSTPAPGQRPCDWSGPCGAPSRPTSAAGTRPYAAARWRPAPPWWVPVLPPRGEGGASAVSRAPSGRRMVPLSAVRTSPCASLRPGSLVVRHSHGSTA
jgi:hypothetical protein